MKSSKDNKGNGSKQARGGGGVEVGAPFPRLHVEETKNAGPRAPPRNKVALYERLTIPANSFVPAPTKSLQSVSLPYSRQHSYNGGLVVPMYVTPPLPYSAISIAHHLQGQPSAVSQNASEPELQRVPGVSRLAGNLNSSGADPNLVSVNMREKNASSFTRMAQDDFTVPTFFSDKGNQSTRTNSRVANQIPLQGQPQGGQVNFENGTRLRHISRKLVDPEIPPLKSRPEVEKGLLLNSQDTPVDIPNNEVCSKEDGSINRRIILQSSHEHGCSSQEFSLSEFDNSDSCGRCDGVYVRLESSANHGGCGTEVPTSSDVYELVRNNFLESSNRTSAISRGVNEALTVDQRVMQTEAGEDNREVASLLSVRETENLQPSSTNRSEGSADVENQTTGSAVEVSDPSQPAREEESDDSDSSMADSSPTARVLPKDVIGAVGQHEFWKMRKAILKQQRLFAMQLFELHRLVKVQEIMVDGPSVSIEEIAECLSASPKKDLDSPATTEVPAAGNEQQDVKEAPKQEEVSTPAPALMQVSHPQESVRCPVSVTDNSHNISAEQQAAVYAAPYSFPIIPGQANFWGYSPYINPGVSHWVGAMATGSAAYGYQQHGLASPFHPPVGMFSGPYGPMFGVARPFEVRPMYPLIGYEQQRLGKYLEMHHKNGPSSNEIWRPPMHGSLPAGSSPSTDETVSTLPPYPYTFPFVDLGQRNLSDVRGYSDYLEATRTRPAVTWGSGQAGPLGLAGEPSSERTDSTAMEAPKWDGNQSYVQQGEHYGPFFGHQMPMYYAPRGVFPSLPCDHVKHDVEGRLRGQNSAETACSIEKMPSDKPVSVEIVDHGQVKLSKRPRDGDQAERMTHHEGKLDKGTYVHNSSNFTQEGLPMFPWRSAHYAFDYGRYSISEGQQKQVIKVVPRAMAASAESAAEILHSIQQERQG